MRQRHVLILRPLKNRDGAAGIEMLAQERCLRPSSMRRRVIG